MFIDYAESYEEEVEAASLSDLIKKVNEPPKQKKGEDKKRVILDRIAESSNPKKTNKFKILSNEELKAIDSNICITSGMKKDLADIGKVYPDLIKVILEDTSSVRAFMRNAQENNEISLRFNAECYIADDALVYSTDSMDKFIDKLELNQLPITVPESKNMVLIKIFFSVRSKLDKSDILSEFIFGHVIYETKDGETKQFKMICY